MKTTKTLMNVALLSGAIFMLAGCEEETPTLNFKDKQQCLSLQPEDQSPMDWEKICDDAIAQAVKAAAVDAPKYTTAAICEEQHGGCQVAKDDNGNDIFMPMIMGYMLGSMMNNGHTTYVYRDSKPYYYSKKDRKPVTGSGYVVPRTYGSSVAPVSVTRAAPVKAPVMTPSAVKASGGFGGSRTGSFGG